MQKCDFIPGEETHAHEICKTVASTVLLMTELNGKSEFNRTIQELRSYASDTGVKNQTSPFRSVEIHCRCGGLH